METGNKNSPRKTILLIAVVASLLMIYVGISFTLRTLKRDTPNEERRQSRKPPTLRPNIKEKPLSASELDSLIAEFGAAPNQSFPSFEALVDDGETLVTKGEQLPNGDFLFSTVTPRLTTLSDGTRAIDWNTKRFKTNISGKYREMYSVNIILPANRLTVYSNKDGGLTTYLSVHPSIDAPTGKIKLVTRESSRPSS